jgi:hypothetical protein
MSTCFCMFLLRRLNMCYVCVSIVNILFVNMAAHVYGNGEVKVDDAQKLAEAVTRIRKYVDDHKVEHTFLLSSLFESAITRIRVCCDKTTNGRLRVYLMALVKSGKTTLINSLLGRQVLHSDITVATSGFTTVRHRAGDTVDLSLATTDGHGVTIAGKSLVSGYTLVNTNTILHSFHLCDVM